MRIQVFSDLHTNVVPAEPPRIVDGVDVVIIAGDLCEGLGEAIELARTLVPRELPVLFVAGNHEYFGRNLDEELEKGRRRAPLLDVNFLENDSVTIGGVRFLGATLWTDFDVLGAEQRDAAMECVVSEVNDYRRIRVGPTSERFRPEHARARHFQSRAFLAHCLAEQHAGPTVVVTHHLPHKVSIDTRFRASPRNAAFASDLSELIAAGRPALWVHGHTHASVDARVGATRIMCNPHGYGLENPTFNPCLVVDV